MQSGRLIQNKEVTNAMAQEKVKIIRHIYCSEYAYAKIVYLQKPLLLGLLFRLTGMEDRFWTF